GHERVLKNATGGRTRQSSPRCGHVPPGCPTPAALAGGRPRGADRPPTSKEGSPNVAVKKTVKKAAKAVKPAAKNGASKKAAPKKAAPKKAAPKKAAPRKTVAAAPAKTAVKKAPAKAAVKKAPAKAAVKKTAKPA